MIHRRKDGTSIYDAFIIYDREQFEKNVKVEVLSVTKDDIGYKVTVGLRNETDQMIRLQILLENLYNF